MRYTKRRFMAAVLALSLMLELIPGHTAQAADAGGDPYAQLASLCSDQDFVGSIQFQPHSDTMVVDGESVPIDATQEGVTVQVVNSRTFLPVRALTETLGVAPPTRAM